MIWQYVLPDHSGTARATSLDSGSASTVDSTSFAHSLPSEQHASPSFLLHWPASAQHDSPDSLLHAAASPEQHLVSSEQHFVSADVAVNGHPPAEQAFSSTLNEAKVAWEGHSPSEQPASLLLHADSPPASEELQHPDSPAASEACVTAEPDPPQQEPPDEAAERPGTTELAPLRTPFFARRTPAATAKVKAKVTGRSARIMLAPDFTR